MTPRFPIVVLGFLQTLSTLTIDVYLPAFPQIAAEFDASPSAVQLTFTGAMAGMVTGQLLVGAWSDSAGRRLPLIVVTLLHVGASLACAFAPSIEVLTLSRCVQGFASASIGVVALAVVRDLYAGVRMVRMLASMALVSGMAIAAGPLLGSQLLLLVDWRGVFVCLAGYGLVLGVVAAVLVGETLPREARHRGRVMERLRGFGAPATDRPFVGLILVTGFAWGGMYAYLSSSSFVFQSVYGLTTTQYGLVFASHALLMLLGTQLGGRLAHRLPLPVIVAVATAGLLLSTVAMVVNALRDDPGLLLFLVPLWFFTFFLGLNTPCVQTLALSRHGAAAGSAAGMLNATRQGLGAVASPVPGLLGLAGLAPLAVVMAVAQAFGVLILWTVVRPLRLGRSEGR
ncbi:multidrug effflux MFS transporter [Nonomuraea sp. PA05]|uniref:Bcr/CflA family efflux MFS transporter n=1 Tax=Nonomuraea sp. PA05 TaxID=2604466 RepID=UPI0011D612E1|nr:Bcr/CflA family efflux MFS transporter [Nonomuraea sp. PA05]TYB56973.1 multidrug effflux MFS transporter [Nonomuraea sp. PA05]